jgi:coiled-coil domain-containing protein 12
MGEPAAERRARLKKLRDVAADDDGGDGKNEEETRTIKLRNYVPKDIASLEGRAEILPNAIAPEFNNDKDTKRNTNGGGGGADENREEEEEEATTTTTTSLPKKQNWDLKRDVAKKMEKLERQTNRAIAELAREEEERRENN